MLARSMLTKHSKVVGRGIAPMTGKAVLGELPIERVHDPVARHLGQNTGSRNAQADAITPDQGGLPDGESLGWKTVDQGVGRGMSFFPKPCQGALHGKVGGAENVELPDFLGASLGDREEDFRVPGQLLVKLLPLPVVELLGIIQSLELEPLGQDYRGRQHGAGQGASARLIHSRHGPDPPGAQLFLMKERRAPGLSVLGALLRILSRTFHRRRAGWEESLTRFPAPSP